MNPVVERFALLWLEIEADLASMPPEEREKVETMIGRVADFMHVVRQASRAKHLWPAKTPE